MFGKLDASRGACPVWKGGLGNLLLRDSKALGSYLTEVENFNSILRERVGRLVRESKCFSKVKGRLVCAVELFRFYWNFINEFRWGFSPAKLEGLTDHLWSWHEFYYSRL